MRPIDADALNTVVALYMAENAYLSDTALDVLKKVSKWIEGEHTLDYAPVVHGEWEWFEDWGEMPTSLLAPHDPPELFDYGWRCSHCKTYLREAVDVRNVWDDPDEKPVIKCCPECGAKMDGGKKDD